MPEAAKNFGRSLKIYVLHYLYALAAGSWNAGIATLVASLGLAAAASVEPSQVKPLDIEQMWAAFKYGAAINALFYLRKNPLPEKLPVTKNSALFAP